MIGIKRHSGVAMEYRRKEPEPKTKPIPNLDQLRRMRRELGMTQEMLGRALGLTGKHCAQTVSRWERGLAKSNSSALYTLRGRVKTVRRQRELARSYEIERGEA